MTPDLAGKTIEHVKIDYGLHLCTTDGWVIVAEANVLLGRPGEAPAEVEVAVAGAPLPAGLDGVVGETIDQLAVTDDGDLAVHVDDRELTVRADDSYEAWHLTGPDGERLICMPGGELAYFPPVRHEAGPGAAGPTPGDSPSAG